MADTEPGILGQQRASATVSSEAGSDASDTVQSVAGPAAAVSTPVDVKHSERPARSARGGEKVFVVGFFHRLAAGLVDAAIILPAALLLTWIASKLTGVHLPPSNISLWSIDIWLLYFFRAEPAMVMSAAMLVGVAMVYLLVFHIVLGQTVGMRLLKIRVIDWYGDPPSPSRSAIRTASYLLSFATFALGFIWLAFDSEKRALHDYLARTYVVKA